MERLCVRVQQQVCMLRGIGEMEEIQAAKQVLKEARNSRAVSYVKYMSIAFALPSLLVFIVTLPLNINESYLSVASSSTLHCVSWLMCCLWMGRCGRDWILWQVNLPKLQTRSFR